jgi:hypothetical protein
MALIARDRNVLIDDRERRRGPYLSRTCKGSVNNLHMWDIKPYNFPQRIIVNHDRGCRGMHRKGLRFE